MPTRRPAAKRSSRKQVARVSSYLVFVSHSSSNNWIANQISKEVTTIGAKTWLDSKDLRGGDVWQQGIMDGIDACQEGLVLVSPDSVNSWWVAFEIGALRGQHKRVTPILNGVSPREMGSMRDVQAIDLNDFNRFLEQLRERIP